jgi:hypothetical protein
LSYASPDDIPIATPNDTRNIYSVQRLRSRGRSRVGGILDRRRPWPVPSGNAVGQPDLHFAFPEPSPNIQTFRLIVRPDLLARRVRLAFLERIRTNRRVTFAGGYLLNISAGESAYSDAMDLDFLKNTASWETIGRKLAISFHVGRSPVP